jgi:hypothetical protein
LSITQGAIQIPFSVGQLHHGLVICQPILCESVVQVGT